MAYAEVPKLKKNSIPTTLSSGINDSVTDIPVTELANFYDEDSNLITEGIVIGFDNSTATYPEEITITGATGASGAGNLTGATRGVNADGTNGAARAWDSGTNIAVMVSTGIFEKIRSNQIDHESSIGAIETVLPSKATKTTATQSIYVDKAATGAGDGTSWTDAFTTIQAAIDSLPTVLEHDVTVYIREGASAYGNVSIQQVVGKGSLTLEAEYFWNGECAAATTPSTTEFQVTAADGSNIAIGDVVWVMNGYTAYVKSTVAGVTDKGSNVYEVEINDAAGWGNIGSGDYYRIIQTEIGTVTITDTISIYINGLKHNTFSEIGSSVVTTECCYSAALSSVQYPAKFVTTKSYFENASKCFDVYGTCTFGTDNSGTNSCVIAGGSSWGITFLDNASGRVSSTVLSATGSGSAVYCFASYCRIAYSTILTGTPKGLYSVAGNIRKVSVTNNATTPEDPASPSDPAYIW